MSEPRNDWERKDDEAAAAEAPEEAEAPKEAAQETAEFLYGGYRRDERKNTLSVLMHRIIGPGALGPVLLFGAKNFKGFHPGGVYRFGVEAKAGGALSISFLPQPYVRMYDDSAVIAQMQAASRAAEIAKRAASRAQADQKLDRMLEALEPLRLAHRSTDWMGQRALEALVLDYLRRRA